MTTLTLGIDLATASARCVALDTVTGRVVTQADSPLPPPVREEGGVSRQRSEYAPVALDVVRRVCGQLGAQAARVGAVSVTGTSGTVVPVDRRGVAVGTARLYDDTSGSDLIEAAGFAGASSLGRIAVLRREYADARWSSTADVVSAALTGGPVAADTSHWLKAGVDPETRQWPVEAMQHLGLLPLGDRELPELVRPGTVLGSVAEHVAHELGLPGDVRVVAGMTDGCSAQLATGAVHDGDTMGVLGTTLVLKAVSHTDIASPDGSVYSHLAPDGRYWTGGASNAGAGVLAAEYAGEDLRALDDDAADVVASYVRYPLPSRGERFPVSDRSLPPLADGEPANRRDAYRALLEGVAFVERLGLDRLTSFGLTPRRHVIAGGATASLVWNRIRATVLEPVAPVGVARSASSSVGAAVLAAHGLLGGSFLDTVDRLTPEPRPVTPVEAQREALEDAYRRFLGLLEGSRHHA